MAVGTLHVAHRTRVLLIGAMAVLVALVATAFAVGGAAPNRSPAARNGSGAASSGMVPAGLPAVGALTAPSVGALPEASAARTAREPSEQLATKGAAGQAANLSDSTLAATRIVKTGDLTIRVATSEVQSTVSQLSALATAQGGYVSSSNTYTGGGEPSGEVVLRIPVDHFSDAIAAAERLGHVLTLTTSADDVTGQYVDLAARQHALEQTRATYLTILGRARTVGATLEVQERIQEVQSQIDQLTGQLKVLGSQASYSTLTVDVTPTALVAAAHHQRHGLSKAWHTSWSRFSRGVDAIVGAIGPIVLAVLVIAALGAVGVIGYRGIRRVVT